MTFQDFVTPVPSDWLNNVNFVVNQFPFATNIFVDNIAALRLIDHTKTQLQLVLGYTTRGDGGGSFFWYNAADVVSTDNGVTIIVAADGARWYMLNPGNITAKQAGAFGNNTHDDSAALQYIFSVGTYGYRIGSGAYNFATGVVQDNTSASYPIPGQLSTRNDIQGESMANSILNYSGAAGSYGITLLGSPVGTGQGIHALDNYRNFTIQCSTLNKFNSGMNIQGKAWFKLEDILFANLSVGLQLSDCFSANCNTSYFIGCDIGVDTNFGSSGAPNEMNFDGCTFNCTTAGILGVNLGTNNKIQNCSFESCGTQGNPNGGGIIVNLNSAPGMVGPFLIDNCYFEGNAGVSDISIHNTSATVPATVIIRHCIFQRISGTAFVTNNISVTTAGGPVTVLLEGNSFFSTGSYVPSVGRPFWAAGAVNILFKDQGGNVFNEVTSLPSASNLARTYAIAQAVFTGAGVASFVNNCTVSRTGIGAYTVTFITPYLNAAYVPMITMDRGGNGSMGYSMVAQTPSGFSFTCTNQAASATDPTTVWVEVF